jgi:hypothetical protein
MLVALNLSEGDATLADVEGRIRIGTDRQRDDEVLRGVVRLHPWEAVVIDTR